jgi:uncharacterized membrane protein YfcA
MLAVVGMLTRLWLDRRRAAPDAEDAHVPVRPVATLLLGLVGGVIVGMTSVGSGSLIIVMLMPAHPTHASRRTISSVRTWCRPSPWWPPRPWATCSSATPTWDSRPPS